MKISIHLLIVLLIQAFLAGFLLEYLIRYDKIHQPNVELPEEYKLMTKEDTIQGYYSKDGVLIIEYNNKRN